jgi:hypothetical protein
MKYHARTLQRINQPVPTGNADTVAEAEKKLGVRLPASVKEWYCEVDGQCLLAKHSNNDRALAPGEFTRVDIDCKCLMIILHENQGVCWWAFELGRSDDPPVYVNLDPPPDKLFVYANSFSEFTYVRIFDFNAPWDSDRCLMETFKPLTEADVRWLESQFVNEPRSLGWPGTTTYRFTSDHGCITIWQSPEQADWICSASSRQALNELQQQTSHLWRRHA